MAANEPLDSGQRGVVITTASIAGLAGAPGHVHRPGAFLTNACSDPVATEAHLGSSGPTPSGRPEEYARLAVEIAENDSLDGEVIRRDGAPRFDAR